MTAHRPPEAPATAVTPLPGIGRDALWQTFVESIGDYAIFFLDPKGTVVSWNLGAERIKGYKADEIIGKHVATFYTPEDIVLGRAEEDLRAAMLYRRGHQSGWRLRKDATRYWADVITTSLRDAHGDLRGYALVMRDMSERKRMEA